MSKQRVKQGSVNWALESIVKIEESRTERITKSSTIRIGEKTE